MKKLLIILSILLATSIVQSDEAQVIRDRIASYQKALREGNLSQLKIKNYKERIKQLKSELSNYDTVDISKEVDMDMQAKDGIYKPQPYDSKSTEERDKAVAEYNAYMKKCDERDIKELNQEIEDGFKPMLDQIAKAEAEGKKQEEAFKALLEKCRKEAAQWKEEDRINAEKLKMNK